MTATASTRVRSEAGVVAYLGFTSALLALGIDTALPAFDEIREEFSFIVNYTYVVYLLR